MRTPRCSGRDSAFGGLTSRRASAAPWMVDGWGARLLGCGEACYVMLLPSRDEAVVKEARRPPRALSCDAHCLILNSGQGNTYDLLSEETRRLHLATYTACTPTTVMSSHPLTGGEEELAGTKIQPLQSGIKANTPLDTSGRGSIGSDHSIESTHLDPIGKGKRTLRHRRADALGLVALVLGRGPRQTRKQSMHSAMLLYR
ncbi:uncharacterized protein K452DRAFT_91795 [Aplosporella prunicola CBS 121167]|uniref:Uncharacterized protein n=1 Tax=Aplosporella prunicola CBS 121167 TaxID=1176127 RepID=A0A6A6B277_9PEZI|nr:uncharacterized protein K452DRAFT_91795 [Aplosporella prunicola CBS 121167]KAF2138312.1 hypothetical protein K452DRAFT_91795 [Aplosporella prunicola CBS 121167]